MARVTRWTENRRLASIAMDIHKGCIIVFGKGKARLHTGTGGIFIEATDEERESRNNKQEQGRMHVK